MQVYDTQRWHPLKGFLMYGGLNGAPHTAFCCHLHTVPSHPSSSWPILQTGQLNGGSGVCVCVIVFLPQPPSYSIGERKVSLAVLQHLHKRQASLVWRYVLKSCPRDKMPTGFPGMEKFQCTAVTLFVHLLVVSTANPETFPWQRTCSLLILEAEGDPVLWRRSVVSPRQEPVHHPLLLANKCFCCSCPQPQPQVMRQTSQAWPQQLQPNPKANPLTKVTQQKALGNQAPCVFPSRW